MRNYKKIILSNGIPLYFYQDPDMKKVYVDYGVFYGSHGKWYDFIYDNKKYHVLPGCAHFIEHILCEHSKFGNFFRNYSAKNYYCNATTGLDFTHFYFEGTTDIYQAIKELIEMVDIPVFDQESVIKTAPAIAKETLITRDKTGNVIAALLNRNIYGGYEKYTDTLSTIGNEQTTYQIDYDMLKVCYDAFYSDDNKALVIAGNLDEFELVSYLESIYASIPKHESRLEIIPVEDNGIRVSYDELEMNVTNEIDTIGLKFNIPDGFTYKEAAYYFDILYKTVFKSTSELQIQNKVKGILDEVFINSRFFDDNTIILTHGVYTKEQSEYFKYIITNYNYMVDEETFELEKKVQIVEEAKKYNDKRKYFMSFFGDYKITEDFQDIEVVKNLTYERYQEFVLNLKLIDQTKAKILKKM